MASSCVIKVKNEARLRRQRLQGSTGPGDVLDYPEFSEYTTSTFFFSTTKHRTVAQRREYGTPTPAATAKCEERQKKDDEQTKQ